MYWAVGGLDIGRICMKNAGREKGRMCVVVGNVEGNFVLVTGPRSLTGVRRRKVNLTHLISTPKRISITQDASDEAVLAAIETEGMKEYMREAQKTEIG